VITKSGSFFSYGDERIGQGRNNAKAYLNEHLEVAREVESEIYEALGVEREVLRPVPEPSSGEAEEEIEKAA
jgi:recombination protein RecA